MKHKRYEKIGEDLYFGQLRNGLNVNVVAKPGFRLSYAVLPPITAARTGASPSAERCTTRLPELRTFLSTRCLTCPTATMR